MTTRRALLASTAHVIPSAHASSPVAATGGYARPQMTGNAANIPNAQGPVIGTVGTTATTYAVDVMLRRSVDSEAMVEYWDLTDDLVDGLKAVRARAETYLPRFAEEKDAAYQSRLKHTKFTNVYRDIVESLASKPFEREVALVETDKETTPPSQIIDFIEDVDGSGNNLTVFANQAFFNGINSALHWLFVDFSELDETIVTRADAKRAGVRPYWSHVLGRNVLVARSSVINGKETLTFVKIFEPGAPDHVREFERMPNGVVEWRLYRKTDTLNESTQYVLDNRGVVTIGVIPLVPFIVGRRDGRTFRVFPAMRDAADLQVELYQSESALKFARTLTGYPMLAANGINPPKDAAGNVIPIAVGPSRVLYGGVDGNGNGGSWAYVEPAATSLAFLASDAKETISQLRELGRQPLTAQSGNLTVITAATAAGKAKSAVGAWALALKDTLENALVLTAMWYALQNYDPQVSVYTDFDEFLEGKDVEAIQAARAAGDISHETYIAEMKRRGVLSPEVDHAIERERLLAETPDDAGVDPDPIEPDA